LFGFGVGTNKNLGTHLTMFADVRVMFVVDWDSISGMVPIRAGLSYRF
jgi:hypothetical protein